MTRYDGTAIDLSADSKTVKYGDITNDKQYYISAADGKSLVDVSVNGTSVASSVSQYILERSALADDATVSITTEYPEVNYDFSITLGNNTPTDCFLSILVDGEEVAFSDLKSSYKMGTVIKFTPSPKYKFSAFSVSPDPDSKYNAYSDPWEITISANTKVTATASAVDVYTITATLIGESGSANITTGGNTYTLSSDASTQIYYPKSAEGTAIYINNGDPTNYQISSIKINGTDVESISQGASSANENRISGDATIEVTTADLLAGKITFNFDNYENVNLRDANYNTLVIKASPKSPTREQQIHPEFISVISIPASLRKPPSIPISPNSFSINTSFSP